MILPGAVERLRGARLEETPVDGFGPDAVRVLSAMDPANPYGALLPWPVTGGDGGEREAAGPEGRARSKGTGGPRRVAGAWVIVVAGRPAIYLAAGARALTTFPANQSGDGGELALALDALRGLAGGGRKRLLIRQIDGVPALESPLREALMGVGFESDYDALVPTPSGIARQGTGGDPNAVPCAGPRRRAI